MRFSGIEKDADNEEEDTARAESYTVQDSSLTSQPWR